MPVIASTETFEYRNESPSPEGFQTFTVDWSTGFIRCQAVGFWSLKLASDHLKKWTECIEKIRCSGLQLRILADVRQSAVQSREVAEFLGKATSKLYRADDRIAMVFGDSLQKMQMRRLMESDYREFFISIEAAETWLLAFDPARRVVLPGSIGSRADSAFTQSRGRAQAPGVK